MERGPFKYVLVSGTAGIVVALVFEILGLLDDAGRPIVPESLKMMFQLALWPTSIIGLVNMPDQEVTLFIIAALLNALLYAGAGLILFLWRSS